MKIYRLEIVGFNDRELRQRLYRLAEDVQHVTNRIWQLWEAWHVGNDSRAQIVAHLDADRAWRAAGREGERPAWPVQCIPHVGGTNRRGNPRTLRNQIEADLLATFPHVHSRIRALVASRTFRDLSKHKATHGDLKGWLAILLNRQSRPSTTHPLPIPFDRQRSRIVPGASATQNAVLSIRLFRDESSKSEVIEFQLCTTGLAARYVKPIVRMATGEWQYKGSSLWYDWGKKKWFALLAVKLPRTDQVVAVPGRYAVLRCGFAHPIQFRVAGSRAFLRGFGQGRSVAAIRRQLLTQRWSRQENYRNAGSANKGHGRRRALAPVFLLSQRWKDFVKRYNHTLTSAVVARCLDEGVGKIVYVQPSDGRFLDSAGKVAGRCDSTGWDYFQIKTMLAYKCQELGIEFITRKTDKKQRKEQSCARSVERGRSVRGVSRFNRSARNFVPLNEAEVCGVCPGMAGGRLAG